MTKKDIIAKLTEAGVEFDSTLTVKELHAQFPEVLTETSGEDEEADEGETSSGKGGKSVTFTIRNANVKGGMSTRTFDAQTNGDDFMKLADSFEKANTHRTLVRPLNKDDVTGIAKFNEDSIYNRDIKHPIISKSVE